jgi:hypothetical protein
MKLDQAPARGAAGYNAAEFIIATALELFGVSMPRTAGGNARGKNLIAGTWQIISAKVKFGGEVLEPYGPTPSGYLILTEDLHFAVVVNDPGVPRFASSNKNEGTSEENQAAVAGSIAVYGTYSVDAEGRFAGEHIVGSTFPNWNGVDRSTASITQILEGDTMTEHLQDPDGPLFEIIWRRVPAAPVAAGQ